MATRLARRRSSVVATLTFELKSPRIQVAAHNGGVMIRSIARVEFPTRDAFSPDGMARINKEIVQRLGNVLGISSMSSYDWSTQGWTFSRTFETPEAWKAAVIAVVEFVDSCRDV